MKLSARVAGVARDFAKGLLVVGGSVPSIAAPLQEREPGATGHGVRRRPLILVGQDKGLSRRRT